MRLGYKFGFFWVTMHRIMETAKNKEMNIVISAILSIFGWSLIIFFTIALFLVGVIVGIPISLIFDQGTKRTQHLVARLWGLSIVSFFPLWRLTIEGQEHVRPKTHYVIVSNHQSLLDILVVLVALKTHFKFIAKKELFVIPVLGWHMALAGYIALDRDNKESARATILKAREYLRQKISILFFPEGTRSLDGEIQAFKPGAFKVAVEEGVEILPVVIDNTGDAIPKHSLFLRKLSEFKLRVLKPVKISSVNPQEIEAIRDSVRSSMIKALAEMRS